MFKRLMTLFKGSRDAAPPTRASLPEGALCAIPQEDGTWSMLKILKTDDHGVHVRLYSNAFNELPTSVDEGSLYLAGVDLKPGEHLGMGHMPISYASFRGWGASFVQQSSVSEEELDGYALWRDAEGGYW